MANYTRKLPTLYGPQAEADRLIGRCLHGDMKVAATIPFTASSVPSPMDIWDACLEHADPPRVIRRRASESTHLPVCDEIGCGDCDPTFPLIGQYFTLIARYLPKELANEYNRSDDPLVDEMELFISRADGLTESDVEDLRERELASYAHRIIWDRDFEDTLCACLGPEFRNALRAASNGHDFRFGLKDYLFKRVNERLKKGLLDTLKANDHSVLCQSATIAAHNLEATPIVEQQLSDDMDLPVVAEEDALTDEPTADQIQEALAAQAEDDADEPTEEQFQGNDVRIGSLLPYATYDDYLEAAERTNSCPLSEYAFREAKADTASGFATYKDYVTWAAEHNAKCKCGKCEKIAPISETFFHESKERASELRDRSSFEEAMMSIGITREQNDAYMKWCEVQDIYQWDLETFQRWRELMEEPTEEQIQEARAIHPYDEEDDFFELSKNSWCRQCATYGEYLIWAKCRGIHPMSEDSFRDYRANSVLQMNRWKDIVRVVYLVIKADEQKSWDEAFYDLCPKPRHRNLQHDYPEVWEHYANGKELDPDVWSSCGEQRTRVLWEFSAVDPLGFSKSDGDLDPAQLVSGGASSTAADDNEYFKNLARQVAAEAEQERADDLGIPVGLLAEFDRLMDSNIPWPDELQEWWNHVGREREPAEYFDFDDGTRLQVPIVLHRWTSSPPLGGNHGDAVAHWLRITHGITNDRHQEVLDWIAMTDEEREADEDKRRRSYMTDEEAAEDDEEQAANMLCAEQEAIAGRSA